MVAFTQKHIIVGVVAVLTLVLWVSMDSAHFNFSEKFPGLHGNNSPDTPATSSDTANTTSSPEPIDETPPPPPPDPLDGTRPRFYSSSFQSSDEFLSGVTNMTKPHGINKVMGLIFFGRRQTSSVLDCYLKRNLVKNGGMLDGVIWLERTSVPEDLAHLGDLIDSEPDYVRWRVDVKAGEGYSASYDQIEDDTLYIKMDDDIVFIEDTVISSLVHTRIRRPDYFVISANVVNQPMISWIHWNLGAVKPYLPELDSDNLDEPPNTRFDWRVSSLPSWDGPDDFDFANFTSPDPKHRWLPLRDKTHHVLDHTPIQNTQYDPFGRGWREWRIGAQEHYSLIENLEKNELWRYKFHTWDFQYARMGIQFIAIMGRDINAAKPIGSDDEHHFAVTMPKRLGRHAVADGRGVVAHYSFSTQRTMGSTDILDRYRDFAKENICISPMLWSSEKDDSKPIAEVPIEPGAEISVEPEAGALVKSEAESPIKSAGEVPEKTIAEVPAGPTTEIRIEPSSTPTPSV